MNDIEELGRVYLNAGDTLPSVAITVLEESTGLAKNFTGWSTPTFSLRRIDLTSPALDAAVAIFDDRLGGKLRYDWVLNDTDALGSEKPYIAVFNALDPAGKKASFPNDDKRLLVYILPRVGT